MDKNGSRKDNDKVDSPDQIVDYEINEDKLKELSDLVSSPVEDIYQEGPTTIIKFKNGQVLPLHGGGAQILDYKESSCDFCGSPRSEVGILGAPPDQNSPLICPNCATRFVEIFADNGVEIRLDISKFSPNLLDQLSKVSKPDNKS